MIRSLCTVVTCENVSKLKNLYLAKELSHKELHVKLENMCKTRILNEIKKIESSFHMYKYTYQSEQNLISSFVNECKLHIKNSKS